MSWHHTVGYYDYIAPGNPSAPYGTPVNLQLGPDNWAEVFDLVDVDDVDDIEQDLLAVTLQELDEMSDQANLADVIPDDIFA